MYICTVPFSQALAVGPGGLGDIVSAPEEPGPLRPGLPLLFNSVAACHLPATTGFLSLTQQLGAFVRVFSFVCFVNNVISP